MVIRTLFLLCLVATAQAIDLPETFSAESFTIGVSKKFFIQGEEEFIATVHRKVHSHSYELVDRQRNLCSVATLDKAHTELGTKFNIHDAEGGYLGAIIEEPFSFLPEYHFFSPSGKLVAIANANFLHTEYLLTDPETGTLLAILFRPAIRVGGDWSASIVTPFELDPYVFVSFLVIRSDS